jgi:RNA polymerase sigma factor (sigma-70 family)
MFMNDVSDQKLLHEYAANRSEVAFSTLVSRHIDLVYSVSIRLVRDAHLAEDVTQAVFSAAARDAANLRECTVFSAWLHRTARNQAALIVRKEVRRRHRENIAATMKEELLETGPDWDRLAPELDEALERLSPADRDALLLRFFERKTAREIGERLGLSDEAAQKRVARALERLRALFAEKGVIANATALSAALSLHAVQAAPAALAAVVTAASLSVGTSIPTILMLMASTKIKTTVVSLLAAGIATTVIIQQRTIGRLRDELAKPETPQNVLREEPSITDKEAARLRAEHSELLRLRGEVTLLRQQAGILASAAKEVLATPTNSTPIRDSGFIPIDTLADVGLDTPVHAFQSFLAALKSGDPKRIESVVHWDISWKDDVTDEDRALVEKSKQDYLQMLQRAPQKISAFNLAPVPDDATERARVFFQTRLNDGTPIQSNFEMAQVEGQWKPVMGIGWAKYGTTSQFRTTPVFGPEIDLED